MFAISGMAITLFLGGWTAPLALLDWLPSWLWFFGKADGAHFTFYLDTRDRAAIAHRSLIAFCLEIHASDGADQTLLTPGLWRFLPPGLVAGRFAPASFGSLPFCWVSAGWRSTIREAVLSVCPSECVDKKSNG